MKSKQLFMRFCFTQLDISLHSLFREKGDDDICFTNSERTLGLQAVQGLHSAVSGFWWLCTYAVMQMYLPTELGGVVYKHKALEDAQLRQLCLSNTVHAQEHEYHLFIPSYALSLCIINVEKLAFFNKVLVDDDPPERIAEGRARPYLPKGLRYASILNLHLFRHS